jgi:hypothetical protein
MVALLALALFLTRGPGQTGPDVSKDEAVAIARPYVKFEPEGHNIRFIRRGIPPRAFWVVSFWIQRDDGSYSRITVALVDANTGRVTEVKRAA